MINFWIVYCNVNTQTACVKKSDLFLCYLPDRLHCVNLVSCLLSGSFCPGSVLLKFTQKEMLTTTIYSKMLKSKHKSCSNLYSIETGKRRDLPFPFTIMEQNRNTSVQFLANVAFGLWPMLSCFVFNGSVLTPLCFKSQTSGPP